MRALTVIPGKANSAAVVEMPEPPASDGPILVRTLAVGVCGTDAEIVSGQYGWPPRGEERLILGHESLGEVEAAPAGSGFSAGDRVVGIVRRPDPVPCIACGIGEWDMCRNGRYTERGIKERHGYASERFRIEPDFLVKLAPGLDALGVLLEPASVVAKAWEHIERIGRRARWEPATVLVTGAGPIGLLAALLGRQRGLDVHVLDRVTEGPKPQLVRNLGGTYHSGPMAGIGIHPDIVVECTGAASLVMDATLQLAADGIVCLAGVSSGGRRISVDVGMLNRDMVLDNNVMFGTVNANLRHYQAAAEALAKADQAWLGRLISRREPLGRWQRALTRQPDDIKVVIDFTL
ncbi:glucose 1-dehydrogenase [Siccirubricoccus sp. G192]|uniref:glucose 1-dehydrogenase n=1 Tax=Siccirubricoccus sp. G192 TaxID=2849651 RepID=UPI001C2C2EC9|nr:glucose 1-dehydrogenase [Siccirubricoccus sp. G192]MBV1796683.1 glucose 1-dehydrogenase [Siccirubricoccus sp. G192]